MHHPRQFDEREALAQMVVNVRQDAVKTPKVADALGQKRLGLLGASQKTGQHLPDNAVALDIRGKIIRRLGAHEAIPKTGNKSGIRRCQRQRHLDDLRDIHGATEQSRVEMNPGQVDRRRTTVIGRLVGGKKIEPTGPEFHALTLVRHQTTSAIQPVQTVKWTADAWPTPRFWIMPAPEDEDANLQG